MQYDCRSCGACCVGDLDDGYGFACVTVDDVKRMTKYAKGKLNRERTGGDTYLTTPGVYYEEFGKICGFLRGTPGRRVSCGIYETRPDVCRSYQPGGRGCKAARAELGLDV